MQSSLAYKKPFCKKLRHSISVRHSISEKTIDKTIGYFSKAIG